MTGDRAEVGVFGGSGFYEFLDDVSRIPIHTPYGAPSAPAAVGTIEGTSVAFLPRHGDHHELPPHRVNYRANVWAMRELGVTRIIGPCAAGSLQPHVRPGEFVLCDQLVDRTWGGTTPSSTAVWWVTSPSPTPIAPSSAPCSERRPPRWA